MLRTVFFDIDNTLLLKRPGIPERVFEFAAAYIPDLSFEQVEKAYAASELWQGRQIMKENETGARMPDEEYIAQVAGVYCQSLGLELPGISQKLAQMFSRGCKNEYVLAPGAREVLAELQAAGLSLGIVSNNHGGIRAQLEKQGIAGYFDPIIISEEVGFYKPDGAILELACRQAGAPPEQCAYVGDHPFDILCAHAAHMPVIWMPANRFMEAPDFAGAPDFTISSLQEVLKIVQNGRG